MVGPDPFDHQRPTDRTGALEFRDVRKHYATGGEVVRAVDGVSLTVAPGELVALFGPSGSGKSTLMLMAAAVLRPDSGAIYVGDREISTLSEHDAARYRMHDLGFVRQTFNLLAGATALDNAAIKLLGTGLSVKQARGQVEPLLEELGLQDRLKHRPDQLSMGERQRVMIARALSTGPGVVLADEPTGSLDSKRTHEVLGMLKTMTEHRRMATLLVTHDAHAVEYADRTYVLEDGALAETTPTAIPSPS